MSLDTTKKVTTLSSPETIELYGLRVLIASLEMEILGMKSRGGSAYVRLKKRLNIKGNRSNVLEQAKAIYTEALSLLSK